MKTTAVIFLTLVLAAPALAAKGKPAPAGFKQELTKLGISCPRTTVRLQGTFGSAGDGFMAVEITKATGKAAKLAGKQVGVRLLRSTRITRHGNKTVVSKLKAGNRLSVVALVCSQGLVARSVTA